MKNRLQVDKRVKWKQVGTLHPEGLQTEPLP